ncbi:MAG: hypothetical protein A3F68_04370 [Acidobacteria bacterium RIFCSPLOWO2_12_FULL_54_10]|nr:MAG: hypothetical protein A3F68_04370 [Acidobacteria bacterium RIFCSPLOWO2_12_FULL_54_10]
MAEKSPVGMAVKLVIGVVLLFVVIVGLSYGSLLREMDLAADDFQKGDAESSLKRYAAIEQNLRSAGMIRYIPERDRQNLLLNEARLLYGLDRMDQATEALDRESDIAGGMKDGRFVLIRSNIAFRKSIKTFMEAEQKDPQVLEETLIGIEDSLRDALRLDPDNWDAKYNLEFIAYLRKQMFEEGQEGKLEILERVRVQEKPNLTPDQMH